MPKVGIGSHRGFFIRSSAAYKNGGPAIKSVIIIDWDLKKQYCTSLYCTTVQLTLCFVRLMLQFHVRSTHTSYKMRIGGSLLTHKSERYVIEISPYWAHHLNSEPQASALSLSLSHTFTHYQTHTHTSSELWSLWAGALPDAIHGPTAGLP